MGDIHISEMWCEYAKNPLGIDSRRPRLSWALEAEKRRQVQSAYRIIISSSPELAENEKGDSWDSGKIFSNQSVNIEVSSEEWGFSGRKFWWRVRVWDANDKLSAFSKIGSFEFGLLKSEDWMGKWIGGGKLLRGSFSIEGQDVVFARAYVVGLGYYELTINGIKIGKNVLLPAWTDYEKTMLYDTYDVTTALKEGKNVVGISLGKGRYLPAKESDLAVAGYGPVKALLQLNLVYADGRGQTFFTDPSVWKCADGPVVADDLFTGETYDSRLEKPGWDTAEYDDSEFRASTLEEPPRGVLISAATLPPIRILADMPARDIYCAAPGVFVYDFGQNYSGWVRLSIKGPRGTEVKLRYAELLDRKHQLNPRSNEWAESTDIYILKGDGVEQYEPRFTYHGFRYVELTGFPGTPNLETLVGKFIHSDVPGTGGFSSSNELLNQIHKNIRWTQLSNLMGIPTDCPQRNERMGWLGDAYVSSEEAMLNFWMVGFYEKWLNDVKDAQTEDGSVQGVAPAYWIRNPTDPVWGLAFIAIPFELYLYFGDRRVLELHYEAMKRYLEFLYSKYSLGFLVQLNLNGDYCAPSHIRPSETPGELISSWAFYMDALTLSKIAKILGNESDNKKYAELAGNIRDAINSKFLKKRWDRGKDFELESYGDTQTTNLLPLAADIVPDKSKTEVLESLLLNISRHHDDHLDTGIVGTKFLFDVLSENGHEDIALEIATKTSYPGYGYMIQEGATTLWERWEYVTSSVLSSHNHIMFGSIGAWFYKALAGIHADPSNPSFGHFLVKPVMPAGLQYASGSLQTIRGLIAVDWRRAESHILLNVRVPANTFCTIRIPKLQFDTERLYLKEGDALIFEKGSLRGKPEGYMEIRVEEKYFACEVGSGSYSFTLGV